MALLKVRRFAQLTLPAHLRKKFNLTEGDYVEAEAVEEGIILRPVTVVSKEKAWERIFKAMGSVHTRKFGKKQRPLGEEEIADIVKASRKPHA